jgi:hypothetical protein
MLFSPVFATLQPRRVPPAHPGGRVALFRLAFSGIPVIQPLSFQTCTDCFLPRAEPRGAQWTPTTLLFSHASGLFPSQWGCIPPRLPTTPGRPRRPRQWVLGPFTSFRVNLHGGPEWRIGGVPYLQKVARRRRAWLTRARAKPGPGKRPL